MQVLNGVASRRRSVTVITPSETDFLAASSVIGFTRGYSRGHPLGGLPSVIARERNYYGKRYDEGGVGDKMPRWGERHGSCSFWVDVYLYLYRCRG